MARTDDDPTPTPEEQAEYERHLAEVTDGRGDENLDADPYGAEVTA